MMKYHGTCAALIKQINDSLERQANNILREDDLTIMQAAVLIELDQSDKKTLSLKDLEHTFGVAQPTMLGIVKRLTQKNLTETLGSPEDKRIKLVRLTERGLLKCSAGYAHMDSAEDSLLRTLSEDERKEFRRMLLKIKDTL